MRLELRPHPGRERSLVDAALGETKHSLVGTGVVSRDLKSIQLDERFRDDPRGSLVAFDEWVIARDARRVGGREVRKISGGRRDEF